LGVQMFSGDAMASGTPLAAPQTCVFNIDTITD
jgi:hypothetical protein